MTVSVEKEIDLAVRSITEFSDLRKYESYVRIRKYSLGVFFVSLFPNIFWEQVINMSTKLVLHHLLAR